MSNRWVGFVLAIVIGIAAGLYYGWVLNPVKYVDTTPDSLGSDFKADYVLMVAETYRLDGDLQAAARRLAFLGDDAPVQIVQDNLLVADRLGYAASDLDLLAALGRALQTAQPEIEGVLP